MTRDVATIGILLGLCSLLPPTPALSLEADAFQAACETLEGAYEERQEEGCEPDCQVTYICRFDDGTGRMCHPDGSCEALDRGRERYGESSASSRGAGDYGDREECAQAERSSCRDECGGESREAAGDCMSTCLDERCADYSATRGAGGSESWADASCEDCQGQCMDKCQQTRGSRSDRCESACKQRCASACG
jgi:hypothetical protein